ncbi:MAG: nitrile hydratase subunit beta [Magnetovibrio sp.]|nr:nitrile hydratase subunit beta [Magnetovibrio sp.]
MSRYAIGDKVRVRRAYPPGHVRTPSFIRGKQGVVDAIPGAYPNPEELAYGRPGTPAQPLYRVRFEQGEVWADYAGPAADSIVVDIYEHWLDPAGEAS